MANYNRIGQTLIRPLLMRREQTPFDLARLFYQQYSDLDFGDDLIEYFREGWVRSSPTAFAMARPIEHEGRRGWFIRIAVGNMLELLEMLPCPLEFIAFCRNNDPNSMRIVNWEEFERKTKSLVKGNHNGST